MTVVAHLTGTAASWSIQCLRIAIGRERECPPRRCAQAQKQVLEEAVAAPLGTRLCVGKADNVIRRGDPCCSMQVHGMQRLERHAGAARGALPLALRCRNF